MSTPPPIPAAPCAAAVRTFASRRRPLVFAGSWKWGATRRLVAALASWVSLATLVCLASASLGCGDQKPAADDAFQVGLLTPGSIRDAGWNQGAYEGLLEIRDAMGAKVAHQETHTPQEFEAGFRDFAEQGFDLVFGHGFEFQDAAARVGEEYPDTVFITTSGSTVRPNVAPIVFELEQATYVLGFVGGKLSQGRLGAVGGMEIPSVQSTFLAFDAGVREARADAALSTSYIGSWEDVGAAKEATLALISAGAGVLIQNADAAGQGFFQALRESPGVLGFGTNRNQNALAPESILASATLDIPRALLLVAEDVKAGKFVAREIRYGLRDGVVSIEWNDALRDRIGAKLRAEADTLVEQIEAGERTVPRAF